MEKNTEMNIKDLEQVNGGLDNDPIEMRRKLQLLKRLKEQQIVIGLEKKPRFSNGNAIRIGTLRERLAEGLDEYKALQ